MKFAKISLLLVIPMLLLTTLVVLTTGASSYKVYVINTGSMSPNIPSGSAVLVHEGHYRVGQVITFKEDGLTVTHRLISISSSGLTTTKGDGNATNDSWHVPLSQIIGGVVVAPRYVGYWITYFKDPLGLASVIFVFLALWQIWSFTGDEPSDSVRREERMPQKIRWPLLRILTFRRVIPVTPVGVMVGDTGIEEHDGRASRLVTALVSVPEVSSEGRDEDVSSVVAQTTSGSADAKHWYADGFAALSLEMQPPTKVLHARLKEPIGRIVPKVREMHSPAKFRPAKLLRQYESTTPTTPVVNSSTKLTSGKLLKQYEGSAPKPRGANPPRKLPSVKLKVRDRVG